MGRSVVERELNVGDADGDEDDANPRECTDPLCAFLFFLYLAGMGIVFYLATQEGDITKLTAGIDWQGRICGFDKGVVDSPKLFWCDPGHGTQLQDGICVNSCPDGKGKSKCPGPPKTSRKELPLGNGKGENRVVFTVERNLTLVADYQTTDMFGWCIPDGEGEKAMQMLNLIANSTAMSGYTHAAIFAMNGALQSKYFLISMGVFSVVLGYLFMLGLKMVIEPLLYFLVVAVGLILAGGIGVCIFYAFVMWWLWIVAAVLGVLFILYLCLVWNSQSALQTTVATVERSCDIMVAMPTLLLQPLLQSALQVTALMLGIIGLAWVASMGEVHAGNAAYNPELLGVSGISRSVEYTNAQWGMMALFAFGAIWFFELVSALGNYVISFAVVSYSILGESYSFPLLLGYFNGIIYHLGTLAFGAFVVAFLKALSAICDYILSQTKDKDGKQAMAAQVACCCVSCCLKCLTKITEWVNDLVYTDCAINGTDYPAAAKNVVKMALENPITYAVVKTSTSAVRFLGTTFMVASGCCVAYLLQKHSDAIESLAAKAGASKAASVLTTSSTMGVTVGTGMISFFVSLAFMSVFSHSADTLMYCLLWKQKHGKSTDGEMPEAWQEGYQSMDG